jgi:methylthioribose-1-phosphate isomerase
MRQVAERASGSDTSETLETLLAEARAIQAEDAAMCRAIGEAGWRLVPDGGAVLTHCNAGGLATAEYGTALAVFYSAKEHGRRFEVFVDETRPLLQGARLTAWELTQAGLPVTVICDSAAAQVIRTRAVRLIVTGADRIAANGDVANKIGTYGLALIAKALDVPFYVAAPSSTFDLATPTGADIPIEERGRDEIAKFGGRNTVPRSAGCLNLAFDVTPSDLVRGIITERGIIEPVTGSGVLEFFRKCPCNGPETR